jgi:DNA-binding PadR family transcriptional regulator
MESIIPEVATRQARDIESSGLGALLRAKLATGLWGQLLSSHGTVYPLLNRLHEAGLVSSYWEMSDSERPRRYYEITNAGRRELGEFRDDWAQFAGAVSSLLASTTEPPRESETR